MYILDTDHLTFVQRRNRPEYDRIMQRASILPVDEICTTNISFHEQMQGWLAFLNRARSSAQILIAYEELDLLWRTFGKMNVLKYTDEAEDLFVSLRKRRVRIGTMDLRIAAIALACGATVLSRNIRDFRQVPGLAVEDWTD